MSWYTPPDPPDSERLYAPTLGDVVNATVAAPNGSQGVTVPFSKSLCHPSETRTSSQYTDPEGEVFIKWIRILPMLSARHVTANKFHAEGEGDRGPSITDPAPRVS